MNRSENLKNAVLRLAAVLLCLTVLSVCMMGGLFARYTTSTSFSDGARVAKFEFSAEEMGEQNADFAFNIVPGETKEIGAVISNDSEVALLCTIKINSEGSLPLEFTASDSELKKIGDNTWTLTLEPGTVDGKEIKFSVAPASSSYEYSGCAALFDFSVIAEQID